jgi:hypothetical protein
VIFSRTRQEVGQPFANLKGSGSRPTGDALLSVPGGARLPPARVDPFTVLLPLAALGVLGVFVVLRRRCTV